MIEEKPELRLGTRQIKEDMITGFSPVFTRRLLEKLKELKKEKRLWKEGIGDHNGFCPLAKIGAVVTGHLQDQLQSHDIGELASVTDIDDLIAATEEFLAMFEDLGDSSPTLNFANAIPPEVTHRKRRYGGHIPKEVLEQYIKEGFSNRGIAKMCNVSEATVRNDKAYWGISPAKTQT